MKKVILTSIALSISIMSACTPTPAVNGVNPVNTSNPATPTTGKMTKAQVLKFMECLVLKSAPSDSKGIKSIADSWINIPESAFDAALVPQVQNFVKANAALGCTL